jgi:uncharacterized protein (DUF362 family)
MNQQSQYALYPFREDALDEIVAQGFGQFEIEARLKADALVMIKPNLVSDIKEYIENGSNTDIRLLESVLRYLSDYPVKVVIAESETGTRVKGRKLHLALDIMGVTELQKKYEFEIVNLTHDEQIPVVLPNSLLLKKLDLGKTSLDADLIINMPKLKTHKYATITCSLKNMFGCIPDPLRIVYHKDIHKAVADISSLFLDKTFVVLDGIRCMEGQGPMYGNSMDMNLVGFGDDMLVNDAVGAQIMGFDPRQIKHIRYFQQRYHDIPLDNVKMIGALRIEEVRRDFTPSRKNWFVRTEEQLMRNRAIVRLLFSDFVRQHITYRFRKLFKKLRGGSYRWYIEDDDHIGHNT